MLELNHTFFGLTNEYIQRVYDQIFELIMHSEGGFEYESILRMPVNVRSYYYAKLVEFVNKRNAEYERLRQDNR
jgi:hypothetical protein